MRRWRYDPVYADNLTTFMALGRTGALRGFQAITMDGFGQLHPDLAYLHLQPGCLSRLFHGGQSVRAAGRGRGMPPARPRVGASRQVWETAA